MVLLIHVLVRVYIFARTLFLLLLCVFLWFWEEMVVKKSEKRRKKRGRAPCCDKEGVKRGAWTPEEDKILVGYMTKNGHGTWRNLPKLAGLLRCGKSCRLRWTNYLRPDIKRGPFTPQEEQTIIHLHQRLGSKWAAIACKLPGRTDNDIKNFWNSHLRKRIEDQSSSTSKPLPTSKAVLLGNVKPLNKNPGDYFMRLWNSEVGESFRNKGEIALECDGGFSSSQGSKPEDTIMRAAGNCCKEEPEDLATYSDTSKSIEMDDSSDAMLMLLLDFPTEENDMGFLQTTFDRALYT